MDYVNPIGKTGDKVPYVDADPANGIEGDPVASDAWEHTMLEIVNAIEQAGLTPDGNNLTQLSQAIIALISQNAVAGVEVGSIVWVAKPTAPTGWLKCNGALLSRAAYVDLFAAIGTTFGAGDGTTTFALPDLRGEFIRGWDDSRGIDSGRGLGTGQDFATSMANIPSNIKVVDWDLSNLTIGATGSWGFTSLNGWGEAETRPRNIALLPCIKY